jgi:D-alanine-D-alanine ligase
MATDAAVTSSLTTQLSGDQPSPALPIEPIGYPAGKRNIGRAGIATLLVIALIPVVMAFARLLAYPDIQPAADVPGLGWLKSVGVLLNQSFTLEWIPPADRWDVLYLLLLPTATVIITLARLTFGLRVLGFRAILIAVGFQEIGPVASLALIATVSATTILVRPLMRRARLPLYARISVILGITAMVMVGALFVGPWMRSEVVWNMAFFPVIILAMLAEGVAKTLDRDNGLTAAWRLGWTLVLAVLIAAISQNPGLREFVLRFPEVMLTQMVVIVLISEFLDFRLLQDWPAHFTGGIRAATRRERRLAVVRNRWNTGVIGRLGTLAPARHRSESIQRLIDALRDRSFCVSVFEGDMSLLRELQTFLPPDPRSGAPGGMVLNLAPGIQGRGCSAHLPAMLEMAGVPYTGPDPIAHARLLDRYALLSLLEQSGVPVPRCWLMSAASVVQDDLPYPLIVQPRYEPESARRIVRNARDLDEALQQIAGQSGQEVLIEEYFDSREIRVSILGNGNIECLPLLQVNAVGTRKRCPAPVDESLGERVRSCAARAYAAAGCRDYARIDVRLTASGEPRVVYVRCVGILARCGSFVTSAVAAGYSFGELLNRIVDEAWARYGVVSTPVLPQHRPNDRRPAANSPTNRQAAVH